MSLRRDARRKTLPIHAGGSPAANTAFINERRGRADMSSTPVLTVAALLVGVTVGSLFAFLRVPIPAPPELPGVMAIVGIYLGFKLVGYAGVGFDLLDALGL
jgi:XapX domain-containing protein